MWSRKYIFAALALVLVLGAAGLLLNKRHRTRVAIERAIQSQRQAGPLPTVAAEDIPGSALAIGQGFDTVRYEPAGIAVQKRPVKPTEGTSGPKIEYTLDSATSSFELIDQLSFSASASFKGLSGSGGARYSLARAFEKRSTSLYVLVQTRVHNVPKAIDEYVLTETALRDANSMSSEEFFDKYGDSFVAGFVLGGELLGVLEILTQSLYEREDVRADIEGQLGNFTASADLTKSLQTISKGRKVKLQIFTRGGPREVPTPEKLVESSRVFAEAVAEELKKRDNAVDDSSFQSGQASNTGGPVLYSVQLQRYARVSNWPSYRIPPSSTRAMDALDHLRSQRNQAIRLRDDVELIREVPSYYEQYTQSELELADAFLKQATVDIDTAALDILRNPLAFSSPRASYLDNLPRIPKFVPPQSLPVIVSTRSNGTVNRNERQNGTLVGIRDHWIESLSIRFANKIPGLQINYEGEFLRIFGHENGGLNREAVVQSGSDGSKIGRPSTDVHDFYALRALRVWLSGRNLPYYNVIYRAKTISPAGRIASGDVMNRDRLQVDGPEAKLVNTVVMGGAIVQQGYWPVSYIEMLGTIVVRKE